MPNDGMERCPSCASGFDSDDGFTVRYEGCTQTWCPGCAETYAFRCAICEDHYSTDERNRVAGMGSVCDTCASEDTFVCDSCGRRYHNDDYGDDGYCRACNDGESECGPIRSYSSRAPLRYVGGRQSVCPDGIDGGPSRYFGVELEVETTQSTPRIQASEVLKRCPRNVICKSDGSLNYGFEIVTVPATLDAQREIWNSILFPEMLSLKSFNTDTCGLHVHVSKRGLSHLQIAKAVCFVNARHNRQFMQRVAQRDSKQWARYHHKPKLSDGSKWNAARYEAVNLQNSNTVEFRLFKGTTARRSVLKAVEFCDSLMSFCAPCVTSLKQSQSRPAFISFVMSGRKQWPMLASWIEARWLGYRTWATQDAGWELADVPGREE